MVHVRAATTADLHQVDDIARAVLGDPFQAHSRRQFHVTDAEVLVAERDGEPVGFLSWEVDGPWCEVLAIACTVPRSGAGTALMAAVTAAAAERDCTHVRVVTTDDNVGAQRFYEHLGYELAERIVGGVDETRRLHKPTIPEGVHDELRYERTL